jgi:hypothetical protein
MADDEWIRGEQLRKGSLARFLGNVFGFNGVPGHGLATAFGSAGVRHATGSRFPKVRK